MTTTYVSQNNGTTNGISLQGTEQAEQLGLDQTAPTGSTGAVGSAALSPDALMVYCQTRLRGIDDQMSGLMAKQQKANDDTQAINEALAVLNNNVAGYTDDKSKTVAMTDALDAAIKKVGSDTPEGQRLQKIRDDLYNNGVVQDGTVNDTEMQKYIESVNGVVKDINSGAELNMINLQSIMSQRQTAIQLTTNLVESLGEQSKSIAANVGK